MSMPAGHHAATFHIRPDTGDYEDFTYSCVEHIAEMLGSAERTPTPRHYEVRLVNEDDVTQDGAEPWCCYDDPAEDFERLADLKRRAPIVVTDGIVTKDIHGPTGEPPTVEQLLAPGVLILTTEAGHGA